MEFSIKKPTHIFALLILLFAFFMVIISPLLSFLGYFATVEEGIGELSEAIILASSLITVLIFVGTPLLWYALVNRSGIKQMLHSLKLKSEGIDTAFLWGILAAIGMFFIIMIIGYILLVLGVDQEGLSNIDVLAGNLSLGSMFLIIVVQSISEEIFFRGFLLEKLESLAGPSLAICITAVLFGMAHMSYGNWYPAVMPVIMGLLLGFIVVKTKNLYSAITAHMMFNFASFILYLFAQSLVS